MRIKERFFAFFIPFVCFFFAFEHTASAVQVTRWEIRNERLEIAFDSGTVCSFDKTENEGDSFYKVRGLPSMTQFTMPPGWSVDTDPRVARRQGSAGTEQKLSEYTVRFSLGATVLLVSETAEMTARYSGPSNPNPSVTGKFPMIAAHYVTWFQTPDITGNGDYSFRWTLQRKEEENRGTPYFDASQTVNGQARIASYQYPLTGPYDSSDEDLLRYHMALMKMSGIDAVVIDFYGIHSDEREYPAMLRAAEALVKAIEKAGLKFLICYEEQAIGKVTEKIDKEEKVRQDFAWLGSNWFSKASYVKHGTRPVVLCFNNEFTGKKDSRVFKSLSEWKGIFNKAGQNPLFVNLWGSLPVDFESEFHWFVKNDDPNVVLSGLAMSNRIRDEMKSFFETQKTSSYIVAGAFAAFDDKIFHEVDQSNGEHGILRYDGGNTFKSSLSESLSGSGQRVPDMIQLATWNDFAEGTAIEPSVDRYDRHEKGDRGYGPLDHLQKIRSERDDAFRRIGWTNEDLRAPIELYKLSKSGGNKNEIERVYEALFSGDPVQFRQRAKSLVEYDMSVRPLLRSGSTPGPTTPPSTTPPSTTPPSTTPPSTTPPSTTPPSTTPPSTTPPGRNISSDSGGGCSSGWGFSLGLLLLVPLGARRRRARG